MCDTADVRSLEQIEADLDALLATEVGLRLSPVVVLAEQEALLRIETKVRSLAARSLAEVDATSASVAECGRVTRSWLVEEQLLAPREASRRMLLARVGEFPRIEAAFAAALISPEHVLVILAALAEVPQDFRDIVETALVAIAQENTAPDTARQVDELLAACGVERDADAAAARRHARRNVSVHPTFGGTGSLSGTLSPECRETLVIALEAAAQPAAPEDDRTAAQRCHDALQEISAFYLAHQDLPAVNGERPRVVVTVDLDTLQGRLEGRWATLDSGVTIAPDVARRLACDAEIIPAVLNAKSEVLDIGRAARVFTAAIRRAAWIRDHGRCTFPRCSRAARELHHIIWWTQGGPSSLDNATWLCAFHHWLVHEGGWRLRRNTDRTLTFTATNGREHSTGPPRHPQAA